MINISALLNDAWGGHVWSPENESAKNNDPLPFIVLCNISQRRFLSSSTKSDIDTDEALVEQNLFRLLT
jgi:hypothetical protein